MKRQLKCFCFILTALIIAACQAVEVPPQATAPGDVNFITETPSSTAAPLSFPQMTGTAEAIPTVVYPTEATLSPEELFDLSQWKFTSPSGNYVITCDYTYPTLFYAPTKTVIKTIRELSFRCENAVFWAPDESYAFLVAFDKTIYRLRTDGSQPEVVSINIEPNPTGVDCDVKMSWSPDAKFLVITKGCNLYSVEPDDELSFAGPMLIASCCFYSFQWATPRVLMVEHHWGYSFVQVSSGNWIGRLETNGGMCPQQIPLISPDEHWMVVELPSCGGGGVGPTQSVIANLEDGSRRVFSESFTDRIDFLSWSQDGSKFYLVSRPTQINALPDPRTPFGLLIMDPETLQVQNLFEQARFVSFNENFSWAYVVFPVKNGDGSLRLDGGVWEAGSNQLLGRQVMADVLDERFLEPIPYFGMQPFLSASGEELASSSTAVGRLVPAIWSHNNSKVATINADHQLMIIDLIGDTQQIAQLAENQEWLSAAIIWSDNDRSLNVDGVTWSLP